jgi:hypothetical protein
MTLTVDQTERGFNRFYFMDRYNVTCSLQMSSLASEAAIWLGCDDPEPRILVPNEGWQPVVIPGLVTNTRMHLTQDQVRELLPFLTRFAETGEIA